MGKRRAKTTHMCAQIEREGGTILATALLVPCTNILGNGKLGCTWCPGSRVRL